MQIYAGLTEPKQQRQLLCASREALRRRVCMHNGHAFYLNDLEMPRLTSFTFQPIKQQWISIRKILCTDVIDSKLRCINCVLKYKLKAHTHT